MCSQPSFSWRRPALRRHRPLWSAVTTLLAVSTRRRRQSDTRTTTFTPPPAAIGGNLIGVPKFEDYKRGMPSGSQAIFVASSGPYDFLGTKYFRSSEGNRFDRLRVVQDGRTFGFVQDDYFYPVGFRGQQN